jgi:hypothetical protein
LTRSVISRSAVARASGVVGHAVHGNGGAAGKLNPSIETVRSVDLIAHLYGE